MSTNRINNGHFNDKNIKFWHPSRDSVWVPTFHERSPDDWALEMVTGEPIVQYLPFGSYSGTIVLSADLRSSSGEAMVILSVLGVTDDGIETQIFQYMIGTEWETCTFKTKLPLPYNNPSLSIAAINLETLRTGKIGFPTYVDNVQLYSDV